MNASWNSEQVMLHGMTSIRACPISLISPIHTDYTTLDSAYIFVGGLNYDLTEGDVITIFSQWVIQLGTFLAIVNIN